jgi:hypothetical protein
MRFEEPLDGADVVVAKRHRELLDAGRDARSQWGDDHRPVVVGEERLIDAERDEGAPRERARQLHGCRVRRRAVLRELDHVRRGEQLDESLGVLQLDRRRPVEVASPLHLLLRRLHDLGERVPERDCAEPHGVLDVLVAVDVPDAAALAARDEPRGLLGVLVVALCVGVRAAWDDSARALLERA